MKTLNIAIAVLLFTFTTNAQITNGNSYSVDFGSPSFIFGYTFKAGPVFQQ